MEQQTEGQMAIGGALNLQVNPPTLNPATQDITFKGATVVIRSDQDGSVTARITGVATYHDRTAQYSVDVAPTQDMVNLLNVVLEQYGPQVHSQTMRAAADALGVAGRLGEL